MEGLRERVENDHEIPNQFWSILIGKLSLFTNWLQKSYTKGTSYYW